MNRNNIYTVNPLYNGSTTQTTEDGSVQSGGTTIIYQQGGGTGLTDAQKQKLDGIQEGAEVNQNAYSKVRLNGSDALIVEAKNKTDILNMSGVYPIAIAINDNGGLDFTVSSDQSNTNSVVTQAQLKAALDQLEKDQYWKVDADGKLYTELDVYSHKEISAYGAGTGGGGTGGAGALYECADVLRDGDKVKGAEVGSVLSYNGTHWYAIPQSAIVPDLSGYATKSYVSQEINDLIGGAPGTLDTLKEIAEALGNDPNFATTITNMINNIGLRVDDIEARVVSLEDMFEWDKSASASDSSLWRIKAKRDLFGVGEISAYGYSAGTVPTGAQYLYELKDVQLTDLATGQLLQYNGSKWVNIDKNAVGLNETELGRYLTNNNYAKKTDITWANLLNKPTTWGWANITGKPTTLAGYGITDGVPNTRRVSAGSGLSGGGTLSSDVTISLGTIGTAGTYTKVTTDMYGRVVSGAALSEGDIPTLQISKISGLQTALDSKLNISDFSTWFTINKNASGQVVSIQANFDFFGVGEISAYGLGETQPSVTTLAGLDDVTITSPANGQTLIYDSATSQWKNGTIIGGGNISLNGTVYKPVNGTITLPNLYEKVSGGTSSQFLKADGSVDGNLYALAYGGDQNSIQYSSKSNCLRVIDRRNDTILPTSYDNYNISGLFHMSGMPSPNWWSGIHVKGWGEGYATWELVGPSSTDNTNNRLYYRDGKGSSWATDWKGIAFLEDCNKVATPYFEGQNIYSDYGWWVVALCKLSPADSEYNYASGTMFYRRGNGIYPNGSVQFNVIKRYNQTNVNFGVLYNGYGINEGEDAPKPCTFTYNGVKYAGLKWASAASLDSIKTLIYDISTTGLPFYVKYFNSQSGEVFNTEIKNSIVELGSDISGTGLGTIGTIRILNRKAIDIKGEDWGYIQQASADRMFHVAVAKSTQSGLGGGLGNYEIRCNGTSEEGIFVRYSGSSYGKLGVVNRNGQESSISYYNNNTAVGADKPLWTVGAGIRNAYSFDWWFGTNGYRMTLDSDGKLFINRTNNNEGGPSVSLAIGDSDTGLHWQADGIIEFRSNAKQVGYWGYTNGRLFNCYFREPSGVTYEKASLMINGNGSTISPSIGFHQPGVVGCHLELDNGGNFRFKDISVHRNVCAGNLIAESGFLYSRCHGIEVVIGARNTGYVHFVNNASKPYYFDNMVEISGSVIPYTNLGHDLGVTEKRWRKAYIDKVIGGADWANYIYGAYIGGQQANPQAYFGNINMGLRVAMTGVNPDSYWGDTLWINGYGGTDVPSLCALHFSRGGNPLMYISTQTYNATSYGTLYSVWTAYNSNKSDAAWSCSTLNANGRVTCADVYSSSWLRTVGPTGWYSESYGGGIYMTDSDMVQVYNNKVLYNSGYRSWGIGGHYCGIKLYNTNHIGINLANSSYTWGIYSNQDGNMYIGRRNGDVNNTTGSYVVIITGSTLSVTGSVVASGEVTAYSDARLKSNIHTLNYRGRLIPRHYVKDSKQSIGFIAQEVQALYPELVLGQDKNRPYLSLNYNGCTAVLSAQLNHVEDEVTTLKNKVRELEIKVSVLTEQLHSQAI